LRRDRCLVTTAPHGRCADRDTDSPDNRAYAYLSGTSQSADWSHGADRDGTILARTKIVAVSKLTGEECVQRLRELGFTIVRRAAGLAVLKRGDRSVMVPDIASVEGAMLRAILRSAGITDAELLEARSGVYVRMPERESQLATKLSPSAAGDGGGHDADAVADGDASAPADADAAD
jgi:hypothetical protein